MRLNFALNVITSLALLFLFSCTPYGNQVLPQSEKETPGSVASFEWSARYNDARGFPHSISRILENIEDQPDGYQVGFSQRGNQTGLTVTCDGDDGHCNGRFSFYLNFPSKTTGSFQLDTWSETQSTGFWVQADENDFGSTNGLLQITCYSDTYIEGNFNATCFHFEDSRITPIISGKFSLRIKP